MMDDRYISTRRGVAGYTELRLMRSEPGRAASWSASVGINLASSSGVRFKTREPPRKPHLCLKSTPDVVLDCPGLRDDYYINVLDWSARNIVSIALDKSVYAYNYDTHQSSFVLSTEEKQNYYISSLKSSLSGDLLVAANSGGCVTLFDVKRAQMVRRVDLPTRCRIGVLEWACKGAESDSPSVFAAGDMSGRVHLYDMRLKTGKCATLLYHDQEVCGLSLSLDGHTLASGGNDNRVVFSDIRTRRAIYELEHFGAAIRALSWCPDRTGLIAMGTGVADRRIIVWCSTSNQYLTGKMVDSQVTGIFWASDCIIVSVHGFDRNEIALSDYPSLESLDSLRAHEVRILQSAMAPNRKCIASAAPDECLKIWSLVPQRVG